MLKPNKPIKKISRDPQFDDVLDAIAKLKPSEVAKRSNGIIGASTVYNWRNGKVRRPQHYTMAASLASVGKEFRITRKREGK